MQLSKFHKLQEDVNSYNIKILRLTDQKTKDRALQIVKKLQEQVNLIDNAHSERNNGYIDPRTVRDNVETLQTLRIAMRKLFKDAKLH
jgi:hypothetical protein|tara:strand:- start:499 stop:762 length:264 start_codon:yes stop_codon:yes gene_type:complete